MPSTYRQRGPKVTGRILVVDDEETVLAAFEKLLAERGHGVVTARHGEAALALLDRERPDLLIMDIRMPGLDGLEVFRRVRETYPKLPVIIMTGYGSTAAAIEATKLGAFDYQLKPFEPDEMLRVVTSALQCVRLMTGQVQLDAGTAVPEGEAIIGQSPDMQTVYKAIGRVAPTDATVLIRGETGTGKELVARAIYQYSARNRAPLLAVNCTAIPETLLESELFGYERGAFTGANNRRLGKFEQAHGGTIFLDEIGDMPLSVQAKILRVLQERSFERLGGNHTLKVDVRLIAATNRNLENAIREGQFREDLYHRLNVFTIDVPPLRERREDVPKLVAYFLQRFAAELQLGKPVVSSEAMEVLCTYSWPGNVRQLEHCIHRAMIYTRGYPLQAEDVRRALERPANGEPSAPAAQEQDRLDEVVRQYLKAHAGAATHSRFLEWADKLLVTEALRLTKGNQTQAAKLLGLTRPTLQAKMQKYGLRQETTVHDN